MKVNELFLKARKDKQLRSMLVIDRIDKDDDGKEARRKYIRLCLDIKSPYDFTSHMSFVETDTEIRYEDYSGQSLIRQSPNYNTVFHNSIYGYSNHISTFLNHINKDSDVSFKVVAFNSCEAWKKVDFVHHSLYGIINDRYYLLNEYTGQNNLASPIQGISVLIHAE
jgi:hypothetical protein